MCCFLKTILKDYQINILAEGVNVGSNSKALALLLILMVLFMQALIANAQQNILVYHVYYNGVLIIQLEVVSNNIINIKVIPLYSIDTRSYYIISDLIVSPTKYRFILSDIEGFARSVNALIRHKNQLIIIDYKIGKFMRTSIYDGKTGILLSEKNVYDSVNISVFLITTIGNNLYYNTITVATPLAIVILGLAVYSYVKREEVRIL